MSGLARPRQARGVASYGGLVVVVVAALLAGATGCVAPPLRSCRVDDDCAARELCLEGVCASRDVRDAGPARDIDGGGSPRDDAGAPRDDAGPSRDDAGPALDDAGPSRDDAGPSRDDAGNAFDDAGPAADDAGVADAGTAASDAGSVVDGGTPPQNNAPVLDPIAALAVRQGSTTLIGSNTHDADGDAVQLVITGPATLGTAAGGVALVYTANSVGDDSFEVTPRDARGLDGAPVTVVVHVRAADWLDLGLNSRRRIDVIEQRPETIAVANLPIRVDLATNSLGSFVDDARAVVRFFDDDGALLPAELDSDTGTLVYWVRRPSTDARTGAGDFFWVYAGGTASQPPFPATAVWQDYLAVYHLNADLADASGNHAPATTTTAVPTVDLIGGCMDFNGTDAFIAIGQNLFDFSGASGGTLSATVRMRVGAVSPALVSYSLPAPATVQSRVALALNDTLQPEAFARTDDVTARGALAPAALAFGVVHHLAGTFDLSSRAVRVFDNGVESASGLLTAATSFPAPASEFAAIGAEDDGSSGFFDGVIDEVRVKASADPADFVLLDAASRGGTLTTVDPTPR